MSNLRNRIVRLAYENPELREKLVPLIQDEDARQQKIASMDLSRSLMSDDLNKMLRELRKEDRAMYNVMADILDHFSKKFTKSDEIAINKINNLIRDYSKLDADQKKNAIAKAADLLGVTRPMSF